MSEPHSFDAKLFELIKQVNELKESLHQTSNDSGEVVAHDFSSSDKLPLVRYDGTMQEIDFMMLSDTDPSYMSRVQCLIDERGYFYFGDVEVDKGESFTDKIYLQIIEVEGKQYICLTSESSQNGPYKILTKKPILGTFDSSDMILVTGVVTMDKTKFVNDTDKVTVASPYGYDSIDLS